MTAAVASPLPALSDSSSADARKRRREIIANQRALEAAKVVTATLPDMMLPCSPPLVTSLDDVIQEPLTKRCKLDELSLPAVSFKGKTKKPQMKYDPEVPMTKEEAAVWRREQRRKRNRESAAASRQRQRDRIAELEVEVQEWKTKFDSMMETIQKLEASSGKSSEDLVEPFTEFEFDATSYVSPPSSPSHTSHDFPVTASPVASSSHLISPQEGLAKLVLCRQGSDSEHSDKLISRPAVS